MGPSISWRRTAEVTISSGAGAPGRKVAGTDFTCGTAGGELTGLDSTWRSSALKYDAPGVPLRFTSKERDAETGLDYFGARYLSSAQGRFTSPDPNLEPDNVIAAEVRVARTFARGTAQVSMFQDDVHDAIISQFLPLVPNSTTLFSYLSNVDHGRARGR